MQREGDQMVASPAFPRVTFDNKDLDKFVFQSDGFNCGMGICAATSLILQEFLLVLTSKNEYHQFFVDTFEGLSYKFPECSVSSFRDNVDIGDLNFLQVIRSEFLILIDGMAEYQHNILPQRFFGDDYIRNTKYEAFKLKLVPTISSSPQTAALPDDTTKTEQPPSSSIEGAMGLATLTLDQNVISSNAVTPIDTASAETEPPTATVSQESPAPTSEKEKPVKKYDVVPARWLTPKKKKTKRKPPKPPELKPTPKSPSDNEEFIDAADRKPAAKTTPEVKDDDLVFLVSCLNILMF